MNLSQIGSGTKRRAAAGNDEHSKFFSFQLVQVLVKLSNDCPVECVSRFRAIEP